MNIIDREHWVTYAQAAMIGGNINIVDRCAKFADLMLEEEKKRFPSGDDVLQLCVERAKLDAMINALVKEKSGGNK